MKIHQIRNATFVIETSQQVILVDPMLGRKGSMPSFTLFRFKAQRNPIVSLPSHTDAILQKVTHCLITHRHADHIDAKGEKWLIEHDIPVTCSRKDEKLLRKKGLRVVQAVDYWNTEGFLGGEITGIPAKHGYGFIAKPMGNVMGFVMKLPNEPSVYISSDTIMTDAVRRVLKEFKPDLAVAAAGTAQLDIGQPLLMRMDDILEFVRLAPNKVLANHLEAVNHCPTTRLQLREKLKQEGLSDKVFIPADGEVVEL